MFILKQLRRKKNLNQTDLATAIGVSLRTIQLYEKKDANIPIKNLTKIAQFFDVTIAELYSHEVNEDASGYRVDSNKPVAFTVREMENGKFMVGVPLVLGTDEKLYLEYLSNLQPVERFPVMSFVMEKKEDIRYTAFEIMGNSMDDGTLRGIPLGALVLGKEIGLTDLSKDGQEGVFILVHKEGILCKSIVSVDHQMGTVRCHSYNRSPEYADFNVRFDEVRQLFKVVKKQVEV